MLKKFYHQMQDLLRQFFTGVAHKENFSVAGFLMPKALRPIVLDIYKIARFADDVSDESDLKLGLELSIKERQNILNALDFFLKDLGQENSTPYLNEQKLNANVNKAWAKNISMLNDKLFNYLNTHLNLNFWQGFCQKALLFQLDFMELRALLSAFLQDLTVQIYDKQEHVFDYCKRSANPVGHLLLKLYQSFNIQTQAKSDMICSAFQLINMYQDVYDDWQKQRLYLPIDELIKYTCLLPEALMLLKSLNQENFNSFFNQPFDSVFHIENLESFLKIQIQLRQKELFESLDLIGMIQNTINLKTHQKINSKFIQFELSFSVSAALKVCDNFLKNRYNIKQQISNQNQNQNQNQKTSTNTKPSAIVFYQWPVIIFNAFKIYGRKNLLSAKSRSQSL